MNDERQIAQIHDGRYESARWCPSPNFDARPPEVEIRLLVIHAISLPPSEFGGPYVDALFGNTLDCSLHPYFASLEGLRVSAHFFINRQGDVTQYVSMLDRAWHAGVSCFSGRIACNDYSVGIELEGDDSNLFAAPQYQALVNLTRAIMQAYPRISLSRIVGHSDVAPGRKTDPGPYFDWVRYRAALL